MVIGDIKGQVVNSDTLALAIDLINRPSISPEDAGCQKSIAERLEKHGFVCEHKRFGDVDNLYAKHGTSGPLLLFLGHTDVVPTGPESEWQTPPFKASVRDGKLFGRGACDMKGGVAAMVCAMERFAENNKNHKGSIALLLTSDEEALAINGTQKMVGYLTGKGEKIDWCLVGEPSSNKEIIDTIKNGRRGSLHGRLVIYGEQGHVAYPDRAANPIHLFTQSLSKLCAETWDKGNQHFSPTSFQISNIHAGTGADNVIPGQLECIFNFRFSTESTAEALKTKVHNFLDDHDLKYELEWRLAGEPFLTPIGDLSKVVSDSCEEIVGTKPVLSTSGGTSDGRFIAPLGAQVVEAGLVNVTAHKVNEHVKVADLDIVSKIYERVIEKLLA